MAFQKLVGLRVPICQAGGTYSSPVLHGNDSSAEQHQRYLNIIETQAERVFESFFKAGRARNRITGGRGLGLVLVKRIIDLHGGSVAVESGLTGGTTFRVSLPELLVTASTSQRGSLL